jgi:hypothetical protein
MLSVDSLASCSYDVVAVPYEFVFELVIGFGYGTGSVMCVVHDPNCAIWIVVQRLRLRD